MKLSKITFRRLGIFMYCSLVKQMFEWMHVFKDAKDEIKKEIRYTYKKNKKLVELFESQFSEEEKEIYWERSEILSKITEKILTAETPELGYNALYVLDAFFEGKIKIIENE